MLVPTEQVFFFFSSTLLFSLMTLLPSPLSGKSTLLKLVDGSHPPTKGRIEKKDHLRVARFHQHHIDQLDLNVNAIEYFQGKFNGQPFAFRQHLARFGVRGDLATQKISRFVVVVCFLVAFVLVCFVFCFQLTLFSPLLSPSACLEAKKVVLPLLSWLSSDHTCCCWTNQQIIWIWKLLILLLMVGGRGKKKGWMWHLLFDFLNFFFRNLKI